MGATHSSYPSYASFKYYVLDVCLAMKAMMKTPDSIKKGKTHIQVRLRLNLHDEIVDLSESSKDTVSDVIERCIMAYKKERGLIRK